MCVRKAGFRVGRMGAQQEHKTARGANMSSLSSEGKGGLWFYSVPHQSIAKVSNCFPIICHDYQHQQDFLQGGACYLYVK